ncbi:MAG: LptF/LptG family permease [Rubrivivax sp.]
MFFIERDHDDPTKARNVFILSQRDAVESVTTAQRGQIVDDGDARVLVLESGQRNDVDRASDETTLARFEDYRVRVDEGAARAAAAPPPRAIDTLDLLREPSLKYQGELVWRVGLALGAANLVLLGIGLAATQPRRASNWNLLFALLAFVVYYNLINLTQAWVAGGRLGLGTALLVLHGGVLGLALALIVWRDHASVWSLRRRRARSVVDAGAPA